MDNGPSTASYSVYVPQNAYRKERRPSVLKAKRKRERQNKKKGKK